jgi:hypothetical protein
VCDGDAKADDPLDPWDYTPPKVSYDPIREGDKVVGYVVNPKFEPDWPHLKTLQHFAALIEHRTGQRVRVIATTTSTPYEEVLDGRDGRESSMQIDGEHATSVRYRREEWYKVQTSYCTDGPAPYEVVYAWLSGFENGCHAIFWSVNKK